MNNKAVTIVELIISIVIISVIASFSVIGVTRYLESSKLNSDINTVTTLNKVTQNYILENNITENTIFSDLEDDQDKIDYLINNGYLSGVIESRSEGGSFSWNNESKLWEFQLDGRIYTNETGFNFTSMSLDQAKASGLFTEGGTNDVRYNEEEGQVELEARKAKMLNAINKDEYTINVTWSSESVNDPRIIFLFDYYDETDLGEGEGFIILFRANTNFVRLQKVRNGESYTTLKTFSYKNTGLIPNYSDEPDFYGLQHQTKLVITRVNDTTKLIKIYLDGTYITEFTYTQEVMETDVYYGVGSQKNIDSDVYVQSMSAN